MTKKGKWRPVTIETRVIPATAENLEKFSESELRKYCSCLMLAAIGDKDYLIETLMLSGKATMLVQLGN